MDLKQAAISISMIVFVLSSMLGMGLGLRVSEIVAPLRNWRLVMLSLVANFVVMPFAALALARLDRRYDRGDLHEVRPRAGNDVDPGPHSAQFPGDFDAHPAGLDDLRQWYG